MGLVGLKPVQAQPILGITFMLKLRLGQTGEAHWPNEIQWEAADFPFTQSISLVGVPLITQLQLAHSTVTFYCLQPMLQVHKHLNKQ